MSNTTIIIVDTIRFISKNKKKNIQQIKFLGRSLKMAIPQSHL
jgi:hypothetical protein